MDGLNLSAYSVESLLLTEPASFIFHTELH